MFDIPLFLMAGITAIGFVGAIPPKVLISHLRSLRDGMNTCDAVARNSSSRSLKDGCRP